MPAVPPESAPRYSETGMTTSNCPYRRFGQRTLSSGTRVTLAEDELGSYGEWDEDREGWIHRGFNWHEARQRLDRDYGPSLNAVIAPEAAELETRLPNTLPEGRIWRDANAD